MGIHIKLKLRTFIKDFGKNVASNIESGFTKVKSHLFKSETEKLFKNMELPHTLIPKDIPDIEVKKIKGELHLGADAKMSDLSFHLESGRIRKFWDKLKIKHSISKDVEDSVKLKMDKYPAKRIADLEEKIVEYKPKMKDYDIKIDDMKKLPEKQKGALKKWGEKTLVLTKGVAGAAAITAAGFGIDQIINEMHKAKGCFLFDSKYGKGRCKLTSRSCANSDIPHNIKACGPSAFEKLKVNLNLMLRYLSQHGTKGLQDDLKSRLVEAYPEETKYINETIDKIENKSIKNDDIVSFIEKTGFEDLINTFYDDHKDEFAFDNYCGLLTKDEQANEACVACNPSAPHSSVNYINIDDLTPGERPRCDANPTAWEAVAKMTGDTVSDVADALGITNFITTIVTIITAVIGVAILIFGIAYAVYYFRKKNNNNDDEGEISYSKLENEED